MTDLNNSIKILENVLSTPGKSMLRTSKYVAKSSRQSLLRPTDLEESNTNLTLNHPNYDASITAAPHEFREIMGHSKLIRDPNLTFSESLLNGNILKTTQKSAEILDKLFTDFFEITQMHESATQIFQTIADYIQSCSDNLDLIIDVQSKSLGETRKSAAYDNLWLENERNLWRLIYCIYQDRLTSDKNPEIEPIPPNTITEKQCVENLYKTDSLLRECQLVVDWLERKAADQTADIPRMEHFTDKTVGWENTLHQLDDADLTVFPSTRALVTKLDPDAPLREKASLHDLDLDDEARLCKEIFYEIRCGRLNEAQALCVHCGHAWRAAILEGWRLFHDPNYSKTENRELKEPCEGNMHRDLWKYMAWKICEDERLDKYWRGTLGILCGNLRPVLLVCRNWEDILWAYLRVMIDIRVESEIRDTILKSYQEMPAEYWKNRFSLDEIFNKLTDQIHTHPETEKYYHILRLIIMDQPIELLKLMKHWVTISEDQLSTITSPQKKLLSNSPQFLRLLAHIVLVFREFGITGNEIAGDGVLEQYVQCLIDTDRKDLIAFYTATLPQPNQITMYSKFLEPITENDERRAMLSNAEDAGLHVEAITKQVVENIRRKDIVATMSELTNDLTESDLAKISALDWLIFYDTQRLEAVYQTNAIIRYFLASGKLDAARQAFNKNPGDTVNLILSNYNENDVPKNVQSILKEYLCYKAYLDGNETFSDWFHHFHHGRPKPPAPLAENAGFTERVAHEHRVSQYNAELDRWKLTMAHRTKNTKTLLYNILLFPDGGWLVDTYDTDEARAVVLNDLRVTCIPKIVLLLHTVMHEMGEYKECIQLADLLADETKQLYKVFNKPVLGEVLTKLGESSLALMEQKKDPWGYDVGT